MVEVQLKAMLSWHADELTKEGKHSFMSHSVTQTFWVRGTQRGLTFGEIQSNQANCQDPNVPVLTLFDLENQIFKFNLSIIALTLAMI